MIAFRDIKAEARENALRLTSPAFTEAGSPARMARGKATDPGDGEDSHIEPWMEAAFAGLTHASETGEPFALLSCFMNGQPAALVAATHRQGSRTHVLPLFLAVQPWMKFSEHPEDQAADADEPE
jgi:hypothetical protein